MNLPRVLPSLGAFVVVGLAATSARAGGEACQTQTICQTDADCGAGTRCFHDVGTVYAQGPDGGLQPTSYGTCLIPYQVECTASSDCGDGFTCMTSGMTCDCGDKSNAPDGAVPTPCSQVPGPPMFSCDGGAGCPMVPSLCDGGTCLCWAVGTCTQTATASCSSSSTCPSGWSCTSGTCEPPCYGDGDFNGGASASGSSGGGTGSTASSSKSGCDVAVDGSSGGGVLTAAALVVMAGVRRRGSRVIRPRKQRSPARVVM